MQAKTLRERELDVDVDEQWRSKIDATFALHWRLQQAAGHLNKRANKKSLNVGHREGMGGRACHTKIAAMLVDCRYGISSD